jgi:hypothetical protein
MITKDIYKSVRVPAKKFTPIFMSNVHITQVLLDFDRAIASGKRIGDTIDQVTMMMMMMVMMMVMAMTMVLMLNATTMMILMINEQQLQHICD